MTCRWLGLLAGIAALSGCSNGSDGNPPAQTPAGADTSGLPGWAIGPFTRYAGNPVMSPEGTGWESLQALNPGVVEVGGHYQMIYRGIEPAMLSQIGMATSDDGIQWTRYANNPVIPNDVAGGVLGYEDPRLVYLDGTYYAFFTRFTTGSTDLFEATSTDLVHWNMTGVVAPGTKNGAVVTDPHGRPVQINGLYTMYVGEMEKFSYWTSPDMLHWTQGGTVDLGYGDLGLPDEVCVAVTDYPRRDGSTGHDIVLFTAGHLVPTGTWYYAISETLYSREQPDHQIDRLPGPVLLPTEPYELAGVTPVTVFMNSILLNDQGLWMMHYGAADTRIGLATAPSRN
ncbi:MAG TPA: hypothetical protein VHE37_15025 [Nevskiaceae bacterium]|nr:hypothetical protein [Nevskiaceae bacterium]